jgi:hypothetical protein
MHISKSIRWDKIIALPNATPWVTHGDPGASSPPAGAPTGAQIEAARDAWRDHKLAF